MIDSGKKSGSARAGAGAKPKYDCIHSNVLAAAWQIRTSMKTTRLAFNLFTDSTAWTDDPERLSLAELFSCDYAPSY